MTRLVGEGRKGRKPFGFPKAERLRSDREYREVVTKGDRVRTEHFTVYRDAGAAGRKVGISVGKRVGPAVARNRLKRVVRELVRLEKAAFPEGSRTAIVARKAPPVVTLAAVKEELLPAIARRFGPKKPAA